MMKTKSLMGFIVCITSCLSACVYHPSYPRSWSNIRSADSNIRLQLSGVYDCKGEASTGFLSKSNTNAGNELFNVAQDFKCDSFKIVSHANGDMDFLGFSENSLIHRRYVGADDFKTQGNWLILQSTRSLSGDNVAAFGSSKSFIGVNDMRDLVIKSESWSIGIALFIPMFTSGHTWMKFRRIGND